MQKDTPHVPSKPRRMEEDSSEGNVNEASAACKQTDVLLAAAEQPAKLLACEYSIYCLQDVTSHYYHP